jgi:hypothetical protein
MKLPPQAIEELKAIYDQEFGTSLSDQEAGEMARRLLSLFQVIYRPLPGEDASNPSSDPHRSSPRPNP